MLTSRNFHYLRLSLNLAGMASSKKGKKHVSVAYDNEESVEEGESSRSKSKTKFRD